MNVYMRIFISRHACFIALIALALQVLSARADAFDVSAQFSGGYDSNVIQARDEEGSGFGLYGLSVGHRLYENTDGLSSDLYLEGSYQQYFDFDDNYMVKAGGATDWFYTDSLKPQIYYEGLIYRDDEFEADDLNQLMLGGRLEWLAHARLTAALDQAVLYLDGKEDPFYAPGEVPSTPGGPSGPGRHGQGSGGFGGGTGGMGGMGGSAGTGGTAGGAITDVSGNAVLSRTRTELTFFISPALSAGTRLTFHRMWASEDRDAYRGGGASVFADWTPVPKYKIFAAFEYLTADYVDDPDERKDNIRTADLGLIRSFDSFDLFAKARWQDIDSTLWAETYQRTVIQCGVSWYF